jgi:prolipoprotein diacylglyceryltransferase
VTVAFTLPGGVPVYTFSLLIGIGAVLGLFLATQEAVFEDKLAVGIAGNWTLVGALAGGRISYVLYQWEYYRDHLLEASQIWMGGISWVGALAGGGLALFITAKVMHRSFGLFADSMVPFATVLSVSTWLGCWVSGWSYGVETDAWWGLPAWDEWGTLGNRVPVQLLGAGLTIGLYVFLYRIKPSLVSHGQFASLALLGLGLILFCLSYLRADFVLVWNGLRLDAWAALGYSAIGLLFFGGITIVNK